MIFFIKKIVNKLVRAKFLLTYCFKHSTKRTVNPNLFTNLSLHADLTYINKKII